jgi:hypothetical protein
MIPKIEDILIQHLQVTHENQRVALRTNLRVIEGYLVNNPLSFVYSNKIADPKRMSHEQEKPSDKVADGSSGSKTNSRTA